jgi:hypothetical protein
MPIDAINDDEATFSGSSHATTAQTPRFTFAELRCSVSAWNSIYY